MAARKRPALSPRSVLAIATGVGATRARGAASYREGAEQALFAKRMAMDPRTRDLLWSATMTGVNLGVRVAAMRKAQGVRRGVPDFLLYERRSRVSDLGPMNMVWTGLALEFKNPNGTGRVSDDQRTWHDGLRQNGWQVAVVTSAVEAWQIVAVYLGFAP